MTDLDKLAKSLTGWLIERRVNPPQWSSECNPTGIGCFYSDPHRAHRFATQSEAEEAMRRMSITQEERGQFFVSEHCWIGDAVGFGVVDEDWLEEVISDSLDMDWRPRDAARLIISRLGLNDGTSAFKITPLGLALRNHLKGQNDGL